MDQTTSHQPRIHSADYITRGIRFDRDKSTAQSDDPFILFFMPQKSSSLDSYRMSSKDQVSWRSSATPRLEGHSSRRGTSQSVTFVDSQDPHSRSAIQRHTAHHSNAQRRDARLRSLRSNRPRLLEWQRRVSTDAEAVCTTSLGDSTASSSPSPVSPLRTNLSAPSSITTEVTKLDTTISGQVKASPSPVEKADFFIDVSELTNKLINNYFECLCPFANRPHFQEVIDHIRRSDLCCQILLEAVLLLSARITPVDDRSIVEDGKAQQLYGQGTRLLRDRLTKPEAASSDENIQAVLLLIAFTSDAGSESEVPIHLEALSRMIISRGGLDAVSSVVNPVLMMQITAIPCSRYRHLTLGCTSKCRNKLRLPLKTYDLNYKMFKSRTDGNGKSLCGFSKVSDIGND